MAIKLRESKIGLEKRSYFANKTVLELKVLLKEHKLPVTGSKDELITRVTDFYETNCLEEDIDVKALQNIVVPDAPLFSSLPDDGWKRDNFPDVTKSVVKSYLTKMGGYTKNFRTGVRLYQCGHVFGLLTTSFDTTEAVKAKCRPSMRKHPPFYEVFVTLARDENGYIVKGGNCKCPAGETQSCVHVAALLLTLLEVSPLHLVQVYIW